jgi:hypothetical protein
MMARRTFGGLVLAGLTAMVSGCNPFGGNSYRFKMTVEVDTPQGVRMGSSVYAVSAGNKTKLTSEEGSRYMSVEGEAVAVDIAPGKTLFALLKTSAHYEDMGSLSMQALDPLFTQKYDTVESAARIAAGDGIRSPADVAPSDYSMLVTFTDMADPKSVTRVEPADLAASFGPGVKLRRITVAVTDAAVTSGIGKRLGWFNKYKIERRRLNGSNSIAVSTNELPDNIGTGAFSAGIN